MEQLNPVDALFEAASKHNIAMSAICGRAGVAATTPSRWRHQRNSANLETVNKLHSALQAIIAERSAEVAA